MANTELNAIAVDRFGNIWTLVRKTAKQVIFANEKGRERRYWRFSGHEVGEKATAQSISPLEVLATIKACAGEHDHG